MSRADVHYAMINAKFDCTCSLIDMKPNRPPQQHNIMILPTDAEYSRQVITAYNLGYGIPDEYYQHPEVINVDKLANHLRVFPQGQFMAYDVDTDRIVGMCSSMIVDFDATRPLMDTWCATTANGTLNAHRPDGEWLYGVDCVVLPAYRGQGIGGRLIQARKNLLHKLNLRGMVAGSMPNDYHKAAIAGVTIQDYVNEVVAGKRWDTNLSNQLKKGFRIHNIIPNYVSDYPKTRNYAVAIIWENPEYRVPRGLPARITNHITLSRKFST